MRGARKEDKEGGRILISVYLRFIMMYCIAHIFLDSRA